MIKQKVNFIGTNTLTVPISQQLYKNWYDVRMVTDNENNFKTYNSQVKHLEYLPTLDVETLEQGGYFDCDIVVVGFLNFLDDTRVCISALVFLGDMSAA